METTDQTAEARRLHGPERFPFTKFLPPVLDARVATEHVVEALNAAISARPVTMLIAPAGSGKTTALAAWAATTSNEVVWIRLDLEDDEPPALAAALLEGGRRQLGHTFGNRVAQLLAYSGAAPTPRQLATSLVNDLGDHGPVTFVLDDVHVVTRPATWSFVDEVLDHRPPNVQIVLGSRNEPTISLSRRRVRGEVAELGLDALRLSRDAVHRVLAHDASVTDDQVDAVLAASGGWAAAVRLATAHLDVSTGQTTAPAAMVEMLPGLHDFLSEEILDALPARLRSFLLETSILDELNPASCDAVTGRADSEQILAELDRRNLFLTRHHSTSGETWRNHDLFAAFLREQLTAAYPLQDIQQLHRRAATALPPLRALPHLLAAGDYMEAADLIVHLGLADLETSTVVQLVPAIRALPPEVQASHHVLTLLLVWPLHVAGQAHDVIGQLEPLRDQLLASGHHRAAAEVNVMLAEAYMQLGDLEHAGTAITHALNEADASWIRPATLAVAIWWNYYRDDWAAVSACMQQATALALDSADQRMNRLVGPALSPVLLFADPGPTWIAASIERLAAGLNDDDHATITAMRPVRAGAALLRLDVAEATAELQACLAESRGYGQMAWKHQEAEGLLMAISLGTGDLATVQRVLDDALPQFDAPIYHQYHSVYAYAALRAHWLAGEHQQLVAAHDRLLAARPHSGQTSETVVRAVAQGLLARIDGRTDDALAALHDGEQAQREGRCWLWAGLPGLDRASILLEDGRTAAAIEAALPTLDTAATFGGGLLLPEARANRALFDRCIAAGVHADLLRAVLAASHPDDRVREPVTIPGTSEALSGREREVLTHVAAGASNRQIAAALFISEPTVKSHLTRILRKLDASSRTHAVARARELRLL